MMQALALTAKTVATSTLVKLIHVESVEAGGSRNASGRMRRGTLLSPGILALPPFPPPPFTVPPGARPIISGLHGCGGWLGLVLYIGPGCLL
eukprot:scaffold13629_cov101-Isochrysis_galbana.AAC.8